MGVAPLRLFFIALFLLTNFLSAERSVALIVCENFRGERELAERIKIAGRNIGWEVDVCNKKCTAVDYDYVLTLVPSKGSLSRKNNYLVLFDPHYHYFTSEGQLMRKYLHYKGYLTTFEPKKPFLRTMKQVLPMRWYPTVQYLPYRPPTPQGLFYFLCTWGERSGSERYKTLLKLLANEEYTRFYGTKAAGAPYLQSYRGGVPYDGISGLNLISEAGICLVMHCKEHLQEGIPTGRIFEASAASAVIICDENPFVRKEFGDAVLYFDQNLSGEEMFAQIDAHVRWILSHPDEAQELARRAHAIFEDKFLLEEQLVRFDELARKEPS